MMMMTTTYLAVCVIKRVVGGRVKTTSVCISDGQNVVQVVIHPDVRQSTVGLLGGAKDLACIVKDTKVHVVVKVHEESVVASALRKTNVILAFNDFTNLGGLAMAVDTSVNMLHVTVCSCESDKDGQDCEE